MEQKEHYATKKNFKALKPWIQALGSFSQAKAWRLQGSASSLLPTALYFHAGVVITRPSLKWLLYLYALSQSRHIAYAMNAISKSM